MELFYDVGRPSEAERRVSPRTRSDCRFAGRRSATPVNVTVAVDKLKSIEGEENNVFCWKLQGERVVKKGKLLFRSFLSRLEASTPSPKCIRQSVGYKVSFVRV